MRFAFCKVSLSPLRSEAKDQSECCSQIFFAEPVLIISENEKWVKIETFLDKYVGWSDASHFETLSNEEFEVLCKTTKQLIESRIIEVQTPWGKQDVYQGTLLPLELGKKVWKIGKYSFSLLNKNKSYANWENFATSYLNVPYLWGGKSAFGIDCSAFVQIVFRFRKINLPRDAYQQAEYGNSIPFENHQKGDVAFFNNEEGRIIHVGILLDKNHIIHASSWVKIDSFDQNGIFSNEKNKYTHFLSDIKRM
ncbi:MAG: C40 family peptidase [Flavobacteriia bacterium]|nr:C40 family peptidase [Flavobacteriia bacterium]